MVLYLRVDGTDLGDESEYLAQTRGMGTDRLASAPTPSPRQICGKLRHRMMFNYSQKGKHWAESGDRPSEWKGLYIARWLSTGDRDGTVSRSSFYRLHTSETGSEIGYLSWQVVSRTISSSTPRLPSAYYEKVKTSLANWVVWKASSPQPISNILT